jgi:hypothetical protein
LLVLLQNSIQSTRLVSCCMLCLIIFICIDTVQYNFIVGGYMHPSGMCYPWWWCIITESYNDFVLYGYYSFWKNSTVWFYAVHIWLFAGLSTSLVDCSMLCVSIFICIDTVQYNFIVFFGRYMHPSGMWNPWWWCIVTESYNHFVLYRYLSFGNKYSLVFYVHVWFFYVHVWLITI